MVESTKKKAMITVPAIFRAMSVPLCQCHSFELNETNEKKTRVNPIAA
jgi:hypothetical protein